MRFVSHGALLALTSLASLVTACSSPPSVTEVAPREEKPVQEAAVPAPAHTSTGDEAEGDLAVSMPPSGDPEAYAMPSWFSEDLVEHDAIVQRQRTPAAADGSFKAFILFDMKSGVDAASCIESFRAKLPAELALGPASPPPGPEGRLQIVGATASYDVSVVCGEAKGKMSAILNFAKKPA